MRSWSTRRLLTTFVMSARRLRTSSRRLKAFFHEGSGEECLAWMAQASKSAPPLACKTNKAAKERRPHGGDPNAKAPGGATRDPPEQWFPTAVRALTPRGEQAPG